MLPLATGSLNLCTSGEMSTEQWTWWLALLRVEDTCLTDEAPLKHALCVANRPAAVKVRRDLKS